MNGVSERLVFLRGGRSQKEIAEIAGASLTSYRKWESGESIISPDFAVKLSQHYNVTLDYIYLGLCNIMSQIKNISAKEAETILKALDLLYVDSIDEFEKYMAEFKDIYWELG